MRPSRSGDLLPLITRDPASGRDLIVTRLECPSSGVTIEGRFTLGWVGRLTTEQLEFAGLLLLHRANVQKVASELGIAYNTARSRLDDIVAALGGAADTPAARAGDDSRRLAVLDRLAAGEISFEDALEQLKP